MKSAILYFTKWGATKQYAEWIAQAVPGTDLIDANRKKSDLSQYHTIVIATRVFMGQIAAKSFLNSHWRTLQEKKVYLLVVGVSPQDATDSQVQYNAIPEHIRAALAGYTKATGVIDMSKLNFVFKKIFEMAAKKEPIKTGGLAKEQVAPVIAWLKQQMKV